MHYYQFHISDWALHTSHLTLEEEAVYRRLLDFYYDTESPIPEKTERVIRRLRLGSYSEIVADILDEFFTLKDGAWHNSRADEEIQNYHNKAHTARANGKKGGRPKKNAPKKQKVTNEENPKKPSGLISETQKKANQEPRTKNQELEDSNKLESLEKNNLPVLTEGEKSMVLLEPKKGKRNGTRITEDWSPSRKVAEWCKNELGFNGKQFAWQLDKFRDYWIGVSGAKGCKLDWNATFRNWCRKSYEDGSYRIQGTRRAGGGSQGAVQMSEAIEGIAAERQTMGQSDVDRLG